MGLVGLDLFRTNVYKNRNFNFLLQPIVTCHFFLLHIFTCIFHVDVISHRIDMEYMDLCQQHHINVPLKNYNLKTFEIIEVSTWPSIEIEFHNMACPKSPGIKKPQTCKIILLLVWDPWVILVPQYILYV